MKPLWLLDVDGVINAVAPEVPLPESKWQDHVRVLVNGYHINHSVALVERIAQLHNDGVVEVRWLTTWCEVAAAELAPTIGLPEFKVEGSDVMRRHESESRHHEWWKLEVAQRIWEAEKRPFVWTDDDLYYSKEAQEWLASLNADDYIAVSPSFRRGLQPKHLTLIKDFLAKHSA